MSSAPALTEAQIRARAKYQKEKVSINNMVLPAHYVQLNGWPCPFVGCKRGSEKPIMAKQGVWRHMTHLHKNLMESGSYVENQNEMFIAAPPGTSPTLADLRVTGALAQGDVANEDEVEGPEEDAQKPAGMPEYTTSWLQGAWCSQHYNWHV